MAEDTQAQKAEALRKLHHGDRPLILPNAWDAGTAVMVAAAGFSAVATTSAGVAFSMGFPDGQFIGRDGMLRAVDAVAARVALPVTADMEAGYGDSPEDVAETARLTLAAGAVGLNLEDGIDHAQGTMYSLAQASDRIAAARAAGDAVGVPLVINGRTDVYFHPGMLDEAKFEEAVTRANAYLEAGADCAFVIAVRDPETVKKLVPAVHGPLNVIAGHAGLNINDLTEIGVRRISLAGNLIGATYGSLRDALEEIRDHGTLDFMQGAMTHPELNTLFSGDK
ncbi:MAG: isocitrate lyase/phosphoenolpyruvate mutase family protein [Proteobacteria bacterium]|nr:isocitrate lyase/phosphoenolpyruvate mutase family protein [Pseudomonadota bacterium]